VVASDFGALDEDNFPRFTVAMKMQRRSRASASARDRSRTVSSSTQPCKSRPCPTSSARVIVGVVVVLSDGLDASETLHARIVATRPLAEREISRAERFAAELPMTATGKLIRKTLRAEFTREPRAESKAWTRDESPVTIR
jgi:acyl-CoA synthetase (AMP-forming)/AMP-acid ligase II